MAQDMGRGIMAPEDNDNIQTGAREMRTLAATTVQAITQVEDNIRTDLENNNYVEGEEVRKIIASPNPYIITQPGDLLLVTETPKWFTDFHDTPIGHPPNDMTDMWGTNYTREVVPEDTALGGKVLRFASSGTEYRLLSIPVPDNLEDPQACEMVVRWRASEESAIPRLMLWGAGGPGSENGIHSMYVGGQARSGRFLDGNPGTHEGRSWAWSPNRWYITRVRIMFYESLGRIEFRHRQLADYLDEHLRSGWTHTTSEDLEYLIQEGAPGLYFRGPGEALIDWVSVSWDRGMAPRPEV